MDPVFTLQWPELVLAERLQSRLPKSQGYSVLVPTSRQEKGIDLAILRKQPGQKSRVVTIQVKASRTYMPDPPKRETTKRFKYYTWFNRFEVPETADFFMLFGLYPVEAGRTRSVNSNWYKDCTLVFTYSEMKAFMDSVEKVGGGPDRMFGFGFDTEQKVVQTRGDPERRERDLTDRLFETRLPKIREALSEI